MKIQQVFAGIFGRFDAIICPTLSMPAFRAGEDYSDGIVVDGDPHASHIESALTPMFNIANRSPVLTVPVARSTDNVPIGAQVVSRPYDDQTVFDVDLAIEQARGDWLVDADEVPSL